jgi:hypothetical protein
MPVPLKYSGREKAIWWFSFCFHGDTGCDRLWAEKVGRPLLHLASATCLRRYMIVAARKIGIFGQQQPIGRGMPSCRPKVMKTRSRLAGGPAADQGVRPTSAGFSTVKVAFSFAIQDKSRGRNLAPSGFGLGGGNLATCSAGLESALPLRNIYSYNRFCITNVNNLKLSLAYSN